MFIYGAIHRLLQCFLHVTCTRLPDGIAVQRGTSALSWIFYFLLRKYLTKLCTFLNALSYSTWTMQNYSTVNIQWMRAVNRGTETNKNCIPSITKFPSLEVRLQRGMGSPTRCSSEFVIGRPFLGQLALPPFPTCLWTGRLQTAALLGTFHT